MKRYRNTTDSGKSDSYFYFKKRLKANRSRAIFVGLLYLIGSIALAALACLSLLEHADAPGGVMEFYKVFTEGEFTLNVKTVNAILYATMLLGIIVNVIRSFAKLGKLFKKTATAEEGFNRNVHAMEKLGNIFSGSFVVLLLAHFFIAMLCKLDTAAESTQVNVLMLAAIGIGVVIHLFGGFLSMKTSYYDLEECGLQEYNRTVGKAAPFFRNLLQLVAVFAMLFFFLSVNFNAPIFNQLLEENGIENFLNSDSMISVVLQIVAILCTVVLVKHATATTEFRHPIQNQDTGAMVRVGGKVFRVFSLFVFITAGVAAFMSMKEDVELMENTVLVSLAIIAIIALVMCIVELIMRKKPKELADAAANGQVSAGDVDEDDNMNMPGLNMAAMGKAFGMGVASGLGMGIHTDASIAEDRAQGFSYEEFDPKKDRKKCKDSNNAAMRQAYASAPAMGVIPGYGMMSAQIRPSVLPPMYPNAFPGYPVYPPMYSPYGQMGAPMPYGRGMAYPRTNAYSAAQLQMMMNQKQDKKSRGKKNERMERPVARGVASKAATSNEQSAVVPVANGMPSFVINVGQDRQTVVPMADSAPEIREEVIDLPVPTITTHDVVCPHCKRALKVNGPNLHHRCPGCGEVFELREKSKSNAADGESTVLKTTTRHREAGNRRGRGASARSQGSARRAGRRAPSDRHASRSR